MGEGRTIALEILDGKDSVEIDELAEHIMLMEAVRSYLDVEWAESVAAFDARDGNKVFGFTSTVSFLKQRCGLGGARAPMPIPPHTGPPRSNLRTSPPRTHPTDHHATTNIGVDPSPPP